MTRPLPHWCAAALLAVALPFAAPFATAADTGNKFDSLGQARTQIAAKQYAAAVVSLNEVRDPGNPDWHNLMGYSLRKQPKPDLVAAQSHYDQALQIDPSHRGALVYSGELALMKNNLAGAEERLARLQKACGLKCEEYRDLEDAVRRYKANGNKYVGW